jgi:hypothetical protein
MLSEARKYKLFLTMAEQSTSQQDDQKMINVILANVGTIICFRTGNPADEQSMLPLFSPYIEEGEIANLPSYNFYMRISTVRAQEPFSGETLLLEDEGNEATAAKVIKASRKHYAKLYIPPEPKPKQEQKPITDKTDAATKKTIGSDRLRSKRKRTVYQLAAQWMMDEINQAGSLEQTTAADYIDKKFKGKCTEQTELGNLSINKKTRDAFKKLHRGTLSWKNEEKTWYKPTT